MPRSVNVGCVHHSRILFDVLKYNILLNMFPTSTSTIGVNYEYYSASTQVAHVSSCFHTDLEILRSFFILSDVRNPAGLIYSSQFTLFGCQDEM